MSRNYFLLIMGVGLSGVGLTLTSCGKDVNLNSIDSTLSSRVNAMPCGPRQMVAWKFVQPDSPSSGSADILFIVDTSNSFDDKRSRVASAIPDFLNTLAPGQDLAISVMLAHGGKSNFSGKLYSTGNLPKVLNTASFTSTQIQANLEQTLANVEKDADDANGEALMYSLNRSLDNDHLSEIQKLGFYRKNAALSVVFVTDENDICYPPELNGFSQFPDYVPSAGGTEKAAYQKYCLKDDGKTPSITPASTLAALKSLKGTSPISLGGIIHQDPGRVPTGGEESIGHGILELVNSNINGITMDISDTDYSSGLAQLGQTVSKQLLLSTQFHLDGNGPFRKDTLLVTVDGVLVSSQYDSDAKMLDIRAKDAGHSNSVIEVVACKSE